MALPEIKEMIRMITAAAVTTTEAAAEVTTEATTEAVVEAIQNEVDKATTIFTNVGNQLKSMVPSLIIAVLSLVVGIVAAKIIAYLVSKALKRSSMDNAARSFLISLIKIILYIVVIMMALTIMNVPMSSIITIFGAAGLAISLALQNCLSNLCGGFIILFSKPFTVGDMIEIDGSVGTVKSISILYTKIITVDSKTIVIPNGKVSDAKIINYTESPTRRVDMTFDISYDEDFTRVREMILDVIRKNSLILPDPEPIVRMGAHKDSSISIDVLVWTANENYLTVKYDLNEGIKSKFDANNIEIPYSQLDVHIKE
ncbi:MAG: mechanosensitive ion channel [Ruminococcus sp.]|nr:mechanosensitive ion channel [Ruminococcus sp.]